MYTSTKKRAGVKTLTFKRKPTAKPLYRGPAFMRAPQLRPRPEYKAIDTNDTTAVMDTTGSVVLLNGASLGTDYNNRIGRKVIFKSLLIKGNAIATQATGTTQPYRFLIVYDKQTNGATPAVTDILSLAGTRAPINLNNRDRFVVLVDLTGSVTDATGTSDKIECFGRYTKLNLETTYNSNNNGNVTDINTGGIFAVTLGGNAAGATAGILPFHCRLRFLDN